MKQVQTRTRSHIIGDDSSRISRNKAALRNKLLKNAKSIQRNRCRNDNITAAIESVVRKCHEVEKKSHSNADKNVEVDDESKRDTKEINESSSKTVDNKISDVDNKIVRPRLVGRPKVLGKKRNVKTKMGLIVTSQFPSKSSDKLANVKAKGKFKCVTTLETKNDANGKERFSPKNTPKNTKTIVRAIDKDGVSSDSKKAPTPGVKNKNKSAQRMLKMKIKAKSQLRSQDGKFARNPNKTKLSEAKTDERKQKSADSTEIKIKLKTTQKSKKLEVQPPRRVTRLSSDSDKMPTLEPVAQIVSSNEEYPDKSTNDLPILSPATSISLQDQKASRSSIKCVSKEKDDNIEVDGNVENVPEKYTKEQKSTRGRKPKQEAKDIAKRKEIDTSRENEDFKNKLSKQGRTRSRKSLPVKNTNNSENNKQEEISKDDMNTKRELKSKKEEGTKETRSTSKTKTEKDFVTRDIPFEVKKLLGSVSTEDLLNTLEHASNDAGLKRSLRYSTPKSKTPQTCDKISQEIDDEQDSSKSVSKKEKIETIRKSSRKNIEKKNDDKMTETIQDKDPVNNVTQNERNHGKRDSRAGVKAKEIAIDSADVETKIDTSKQTRRSLIDVKSESSSEIRNDSFRKDNSLSGKRRSRNKSNNDAEETNAHAKEEQNNIENVTLNEKQVEKGIDEATEKIDENKIDDANSNTDNRSDSAMMNINLNHLQSEANLSVDSGKENSLEISVSKLKATRPKKTWGVRRERSSRKRSLNNVIGILTEGMNIPIEAQQQSVQVLTVQTSLDNPDRVTRNGSTQQPRGGEGNVIAADSAFNELPVLAKSEQESSENVIVTATSATDDHHADDEKNTRSSSEKIQDDAFVAQKNAKARSPANDIILDLSRRKPKGKGSFLEKIVSKIAKQKDALLENEVGSLLDSAAEELTNILNEVGPTLVDNAESENTGESHALEKDNNKNTMNTSHDKESPIATNLEIRPLEDDKINVENAVPERSTDLMLQDNFEENLVAQIETQIQSKKEAKINSVSNIETRSDDNMDAIHSSVDESQIESCENKVTTNEEAIVLSEILNEISSPLANTLTESLPQKKSLEKLEKKEKLKKSRRKSNKRSLEDATWPRKSKRKSTEVVEEPVAEENITQKESHFDDTIISKPEESNIAKEVIEQNVDIITSLNEDVDFEKIRHNSESKTVEDNLKSSSLEENITECDDKLKFKKSDNIAEDAKSISNLEESADKIMSEQESTVANVLSKKVSEKVSENIDSPILFSKNSTKSENSVDIIKKKDQETDTNESTSRYTSKRKSRQSAIFPENTNTDLFQTSIKSADESAEKLLSSAEKEDTLELTDQQLIKVGTITEDTSALLEQSYSLVQETVRKKQKEAQNTEDLVNSIPSKTKKKRGAKKKSLADEHLELPVDEPVELISKLNEETSVVESSLEHFKIPEVKDLLQSTKKRGSRKKSLPEESRWNGGNVLEESQTSEDRAEKEVSNMEKTKEQEETEKCVIEEQLDTNKFERSSSSSSIEFASTVTRSRRKTQVSNDDLVNSGTRNQGESTDDLSENSCASESSYFRKKRFAKKKRKGKEETCDDARADSFVAESESSKSNTPEEKNKRESLCDEHLDLSDVDDIDALMDIQASLENTKVLENIEREFELADKSSDVQNKDANKPVTDDSVDDSANKDLSENIPATSNDPDSPDDSVTLKKRAADNFVVVHKKTGEIMIVEKRKKLTKEAAKFFCEVCATSFTRKSSLKKHTLSQWHLLQMEKSKDKIQLAIDTVFKNDEEITNAEKNDLASDQQKIVPEDAQPSEIIRTSLEPYENYASYATNVESTTSVMNLEAAKQETLEDKLLDEEICKITENMSHDEYVLTDHITPEKPMLSSTPIKSIQKKHEDSGRGKNGDKKRTKKKKNLADEHLLLDSPELEKSKDTSNEFTNSTNDAVRISSCSLTKEISETIEEKTENQADLLVNSLNDATDCTSSACDIDMTTEQHTESARTSRRTRKLSTVDNEEKEENQTSTESSRFSLRPRRSKHIQHYEESDVEADVYFMDISMDVSDETESCNQYKAEKETSEDALPEAVRVNEDNISQEAAKPKATNETRKRKRGRPRLKDQIDTAVHTESEVKENSVVVTSDIGESNLKNQNSSLQAKENLDDINKSSHVDANIHPPKRRGRPRKNHAQIASSSSVKADDVYESVKTNSETTEEIANQIDTSCETTIVEKVAPAPLMTPAINNQIPKLYLSETEKNLVNVEKIQNTELNTSENQSMQTAELDAKTVDITLAKDCDNAIHVSSEKDKDDVDRSISSKVNARDDDDAEFISQNKPNHDKVKEDVLSDSITKLSTELSLQITEEVSVSINHLPSVGDRTGRLDEDESSEIQKLPDISEISEEKRSEEETVIPQEKEIIESSQNKTKLLEESESSEDENLSSLITENNKFLPAINSHESQHRETIENLEHETACDEKTTRLESSNKKSSRNSQSKEREADRKKSKSSRGKRDRISMSKITELSSDSENEDDKIESACTNKNKIVKSVFGRVFGGEKNDKMKEVLNDWVSRSEDDSDMSRSASNVKSCPRGSKISVNGHKKDKKRHSETKKDVERVYKKKIEKDAEVHGKSKNRKKREKDPDSTFEDQTESLNQTKRRYRESKIKADERILRTFESSIVSDEDRDADKIKEMENQFQNDLSCEKDEESSKKYYEEERNKEQKRNLISDEWENFPVSYDVHRKSNKDLSHRKKRDISERLSPSQFRVFKPNWRRSKIRAEEARAFSDAFDRRLNITFAYLSKTKRRKSRKDISKKQDLNIRRVGKTKTDDKIARDHNNESLIASENKMKNGTQNHETLSVSESRNLSKHLTVSKDSVYNSSAYSDSIVSKHIVQDNAISNLDYQSPGSRKNKMVGEEWKRSARSLKFNQEDLAANDRQLIEKDEESVMSHSSLADEVSLLRTQLDDFDRNSQTIRQSDDDNNDEEEEDEENDNDMARRRMSPLYARDIPDSSIENSEEEDEEEEKLPTHDDNSRKPNLNEFSGEKIVIRSPSSGHRSDIVTIAPTDAIEDNALDVPREIESTTEPLQGKILNCDEELFVECCSRLKATSENELRGAKKIKLDHSESYHRQNDQPQGLRVNRDRWRDVESQNSLGSLLESVNQVSIEFS